MPVCQNNQIWEITRSECECECECECDLLHLLMGLLKHVITFLSGPLQRRLELGCGSCSGALVSLQ